MQLDPQESLKKLLSGLERSLTENRTYGSGIDLKRRLQLEENQYPYAIILTCSDSRVVPEYIFDAGLGDIFVCRSAGNAVNEHTLGSIELAVKLTACPLLLVLGHTGCAAVRTAVSTYPAHVAEESRNISAVIDSIKQSISSAGVSSKYGDAKNPEELAIFNNVSNACRAVKEESPIIKKLTNAHEFMVVGAIYDIVSGRVRFLD